MPTYANLRLRGKGDTPSPQRTFVRAMLAHGKKGAAMASYHLAVKTVSRSSGRSATAAAAYRAGVEIMDERTGLIHDYTRKQGVEHRELVLPDGAPEWAADRAKLWNAAELAETRKNSTVAREFEIALPAELDATQRRELVREFAREISDRHGVAVDIAVHAPGREGDNRNHHAHLLVTTRRLTKDGLGEKTRELDQKQTGEVERWRERWAEVQNRALERANVSERVDHRSLKDQGIKREALPELSREQHQVERRARQTAERENKPYQPVTEAGQQRVAVEERNRLRAGMAKLAEFMRNASLNVTEKAKSVWSAIGNADRQQRSEEQRQQREQERAREIEREQERQRIEREQVKERNIERDRGPKLSR